MKNVLKLQLSMVSVLAVACGGGEVNGASEADVSAKTVVSVRADLRRCSAPVCGGFWVRDLNKQTAESYVSSLDFSQSGLDARTIALVTAAPAQELVLAGKLGPVNPRTTTRAFVVLEAYRGMPGFAPAANDAFMQAADHSGTKQCVASPCMNQVASPINGGTAQSFSDYSVAGASSGFVDQAWLTARVKAHGAMVAGRIVLGQVQAAGAEKVLDASQVFLHLPEGAGPCNKHPIKPTCQAGEVVTYRRDEDRCLYPVACVKPSACTRAQPACAPGYSLVSWTGEQGCATSVCDPSFSL